MVRVSSSLLQTQRCDISSQTGRTWAPVNQGDYSDTSGVGGVVFEAVSPSLFCSIWSGSAEAGLQTCEGSSLFSD